ncbi:TetR/AcrR family transcriptional regulator [Halobacillus yeomjeoni]|uniref:TetR/AcrR family transcriptional regulator n=1 Tax=Halobacillus yeomjeoni TaxID=311194 RepID=A0A931HXF0_9BACI|nr:TetR/AcrR family transcriptional regulator [Halobacillus yeomjeoni]MBH0231175.1 TetR/AcrR family transcriptional regulator [Halobacillus yeomjeoni]MCA0984090.1 TetR/AcrR family transcriptional regulator [Halobacillus yeomjeoni]
MTQQKIIDESLILFAQQGYESTSLANIADAVGIKKPSLYNHFDNKEAIFLAVLQDVAQREMKYLTEQAELSANHTIYERLHHIYQVYLDHMADSTEGLFFKRVTFFPPETFADEIKNVFLRVEEAMTTVIHPVIEAGIEEGVLRPLSLDSLTSAFYTLIDGLFLEENFYDREVFKQRQQASWDIFWLGIKDPSWEE